MVRSSEGHVGQPAYGGHIIRFQFAIHISVYERYLATLSDIQIGFEFPVVGGHLPAVHRQRYPIVEHDIEFGCADLDIVKRLGKRSDSDNGPRNIDRQGAIAFCGLYVMGIYLDIVDFSDIAGRGGHDTVNVKAIEGQRLTVQGRRYLEFE